MTANLTALVARLRELMTDARSTDWHFGSFAAGVLVIDSVHGKHWPIANTGDTAIPWNASESSADAYNNAALIAESHNALPVLLDAIEKKDRALRELIRGYVNLLETGRDRIISAGGDCDPVEKMERDDPYLRSARQALGGSDE